jgi:hypothetical protein
MTDIPEDRHIPDLVSLTEAGKILGLKRAMTHRIVQRGQLRGKQIDGYWVFRRSVVEKLRDQRGTTAE